MLADPNFARYHGKYGQINDASIKRSDYECYYRSSLRNDSLSGDSLGTSGVMLDDEGNPIAPENSGTPQQAPEATSATEKTSEEI